ncbi:MAG: hypothetical protein H7287_10155 [Thermoleophilia bacterium]|nr:hypothetical protein [Thermoleophilia bacterium]
MSTLARHDIDVRDLHPAFGFGVAGNFAGHLEQAGEAVDFVNVTVAASMPKGIFPWYVPGAATQLGAFPLASDLLAVPDPDPTGDAPVRIQVEPEMGVFCDVVRSDEGAITRLVPKWVAAFDDCSLRRPNAAKISDKKNWGAGSKGIASVAFAVSDLQPDGALAPLRLACFLQRDGATHAYGVDSAVPTYSLFGEPLLEWLVDRLQHQRGSRDTPLEDVGEMLAASGATTVLVGIGASRYEPYGEATFVAPGDAAIVVLYSSDVHTPDEVHERIAAQRDGELRGASVLRRVARSIG